MRKPATTINEFVNNLILGQLSKDQGDFYVPLYEDKLLSIRNSLLFDQISNQTIYLLGQVGTGKTTALNFLPNEEIEKKFEVVFLYAKDLFDMNDIDIADVLAVVGYQLMKNNRKLQKKYLDKLKRLEGLAAGTLIEEKTKEAGIKKETGANGEAGVNLNPITKFLGLLNVKFDFFANIRMDTNSRELVREVFNVSPKEIFDLTNEIIQDYEAEKGNKDLLLIFNELDHMKSAELIEKLFIQNRYYLDHLKCKKIISAPVVLSTEGEFNPSRECSREDIGLKMVHNPLKGFEDPDTASEIEVNKTKLREIVSKRIAKDHALIEPKAVEKAIEKSGGLLRQFIDILGNAARHARNYDMETISEDDIDFGCKKVRQSMETSILGKEKIQVLRAIQTNSTPGQENKSTLIECLLSNQIITTFNEPTWYRINPLIEETVEIYAKSIRNAAN